MPVKMPEVRNCAVSNCAYNSKKTCHAIAVTIGHPKSDPKCDTFFESSVRGGVEDMTAGVGACKTEDCRYNVHFECAATSIQVGMKEGDPDCLTFDMR